MKARGADLWGRNVGSRMQLNPPLRSDMIRTIYLRNCLVVGPADSAAQVVNVPLSNNLRSLFRCIMKHSHAEVQIESH